MPAYNDLEYAPPGRNSEDDETTSEDEEMMDGESSDEGKPTLPPARKRVLCGICGGVCVVFLGIVTAVLVWVGKHQVTLAANLDSYHSAKVTPAQFPRYMDCSNGSVPECAPRLNKSDALIARCTAPCYGLNLVKAWDKFANTHPYKLVYLPSRPGPQGEAPVNISAWWLPADATLLPPGAIPPRIVVLHGLSSNNNHCGVQNSCYMLRTMGFSCLTPTVRDYGLSGKSSHPDTLTWGYDYEMDLLGAWDYAVKDPDGLLGGPLPPEQVGIMGFSKGALAAGNAFGLEKAIPAVWIDSAPWGGLQRAVWEKIRPFAGPLTKIIGAPVLWGARRWSPVPVDYSLPLPLIRECSPLDDRRRLVMVAAARNDDSVDFEESANALAVIGGLVGCYDLWIWTPEESCNGQHHHQWMWEVPDVGRRELCRFWSHAFQRNESYCGLDAGRLPDLDLAA